MVLVLISQGLINVFATLVTNCVMDVVKVGHNINTLLRAPNQSLILFTFFGHVSISDIDECLNYKCGGRCTNLPGSYRCDCEKGYKLEGERCVDVDECVSLKPCKGSCINLPGSYRCDCNAGYQTEGNECIGNYWIPGFEQTGKKKSGKYFSPVNSFAINSHELYFFLNV